MPVARAAEPPRDDMQLALLRYPGHFNPRPDGLPRLAWELRRRTSVAVSLAVAHVEPVASALYDHPLLFWQGDGDFADLPQTAIDALQAYLRAGGSLWVDAADAAHDGPFTRRVKHQLSRILAGLPRHQGRPASLLPLSYDHVMLRAFYLLSRPNVPRPELWGASIDGRLAVVLGLEDVAGALARDAFGAWQYGVAKPGMDRETLLRLGINWVFYALCLDYKDDQVHLPFILKRRH